MWDKGAFIQFISTSKSVWGESACPVDTPIFRQYFFFYEILLYKAFFWNFSDSFFKNLQ